MAIDLSKVTSVVTRPVGEDGGPAIVRLSGSNALLKSWFGDTAHAGLTDRNWQYGEDGPASTGAAVTPVDYTDYARRSIYVKNNYDKSMTIAITGCGYAGGPNLNVVRFNLTPGETLAAGASKVFTVANTPALAAPVPGLMFGAYIVGTPVGSFDLAFFGGNP